MKRIAILVLGLTAAQANAATVAKIFGDHMVLQADRPVPIWGKGDPGERVTVNVDGHEASAVVGEDGRWRATVEAMKAGGPFTLQITGNGSPVTINDVLVGEVWLGAGQSNMAFTVDRAKDADAEIAAGRNDQVRVFMVRQATSLTPLDDVEGAWKVASPETVGGFSAAGYFFARELQPAIRKPVGVVVASIGASAAESFMRRESLEADPKLQKLVKAADDRAAIVDDARAKFKAAHDAWVQKTRAEGKADVLKKPRTPAEAKELGEPRPTSVLNDYQWACTINNAMIQPLAPYAFRGVLWYQGEHNARRAEEYRTLLPALIKDLRGQFQNESMPFAIVQLPNYSTPKPVGAESAWAELREAQAMTAANVPNTLLAVTIDTGEVDIHPANKQPVGKRLALLVQKHVYGQDVIADAPRFVEATRDGSRMRIRFDQTGLHADGEVTGFTIAGGDGRFVEARAKLEGDSIVVWSDAVAEPLAVRYAWADNPKVNLFGAGELPVTPFRTDDWPGITTGVEK